MGVVSSFYKDGPGSDIATDLGRWVAQHYLEDGLVDVGQRFGQCAGDIVEGVAQPHRVDVSQSADAPAPLPG